MEAKYIHIALRLHGIEELKLQNFSHNSLAIKKAQKVLPMQKKVKQEGDGNFSLVRYQMQCSPIEGSGKYDLVHGKSGEFICMRMDKMFSILRIVQDAGRIRVEEVL